MLPAKLRPTGTFELVRLGKPHDGGYLVDPRSLQNTRILFSFGINDDWSFEEDFRRHKRVPIEAYDHTISSSFFLKRIAWSLPRIITPHRVWRNVRTLLKYQRFFTGDVRHHACRIGYPARNSKSVGEAVGEESNVFLKIDIEGSEYRILHEVERLSDRIEGLVVEFHDVDLHMDKIVKFVEQTSLYLCHIHANNFGGLDPDGDPLALEMTFTRYAPRNRSVVALPHPLDMPNDPRATEVPLRFAS